MFKEKNTSSLKPSWLEQRTYVNQLKREHEENSELESNKHIETLSSQLSSILGLEEMEAHVYLNLLRIGPISASALAKEIDVERTKTYRTIEKLLNQNIVSTTFSKPKLCVATKPEEVLKMILQKKEDDLKLLKETREDVVKKIKKMIPNNYLHNMPTFHIVQGRANIYSNISKLIENSTDIVYIVTTLKDIARMYHTSIPEKIKICEKNGGRVLLLTELNDDKSLPFVKRFGATETRVGKVRSKGRMIVEKNNQMIMADAASKDYENSSIEADFAFSTNSKEMVNNIYTLCNLLWNSSKSL
ncbi:MAG TPA: helix-turn-helix domain-containing protein [Nitrosopumilaceae archaeon]|nr:helix-turn-helix domain-containing protein [Nitrosopumilaceae archaeon]